MSLTCDICLEDYGDNDKSKKAPKMLSFYHVGILFVVIVLKEQCKKK